MYPATPDVPVPVPVPKVNLVGDSCITLYVTISGKANLGSPSTLKGKFFIPPPGSGLRIPTAALPPQVWPPNGTAPRNDVKQCHTR
jgi:hypothetical protein